MGFFSSLGFGTPKTNVPASGIYSLPENAQNAYNFLVDKGLGYSKKASLFQPASFTQDQLSAFDLARSAASPTEEGVASLVSPFMNPYIDSVIGEVNRQAQGQNSVLQQNMNAAGQLGSNRQMLGANDIDLSRMNQIGSILSGQYNTALNTALSNQQSGINNLLSIGGMQQQQNLAEQQAPLAGVEWLQGVMSGYPVNSFLNSAPATSVGGGTDWGKVASTAATVASFFSDERLKNNIEPLGQENGHNIYEFSYNGIPDKRYIGVMAQEVQKTNPEAVKEIDGYLAVDYNKIGVKFREA